MSQDNSNAMSVNPLAAVLVGVVLGATATYFMRKEERQRAVKKYNEIRAKAERMIDDTKKKVQDTKADIQHWAQDVGTKAEREAEKIESEAKKRKVLAA